MPSNSMLSCCWSAPTPRKGKTWKLIWPEMSPAVVTCRMSQNTQVAIGQAIGRSVQHIPGCPCQRRCWSSLSLHLSGKYGVILRCRGVFHDGWITQHPQCPKSMLPFQTTQWSRTCRRPNQETTGKNAGLMPEAFHELLNVLLKAPAGVLIKRLAWSFPNTALIRSVASCMST